MAKAYSLDLRQKVFGAWQNGEGNQAQIARRFAVSVSFVRDLSRRFRQSGSVAAKAHGGGRAPGADTATCRQIESLVAAHNDHTIDEHRQSLAAAGHPLSRSALGRTLLQLGLTHKKRPSATTSGRPSA